MKFSILIATVLRSQGECAFYQTFVAGEPFAAPRGDPQGCEARRPRVLGEVHVRGAGLHRPGSAWTVPQDCRSPSGEGPR